MYDSIANSTCVLYSEDVEVTNSVYKFLGTDSISELMSNIPKIFNIFNRHLFSKFDNKNFIIPTISHHIWLTHLDKSKEMRNEDFDNLNNTLSILDKKSLTTWEHIFWTNCINCIPQTIEKLSNLNIEARELSYAKDALVSYDTITKLIAEKSFGMAADIVREDIVYVFGGFYSDLNYVIYDSPETLMKNFNFFADGLGYGIENYMFASIPMHPVLNNALYTSLRLVNSPLKTKDLDFSECSKGALTNSFTYQPFVNAYYKFSNQFGTKDLAIPRKNNITLLEKDLDELAKLDQYSICIPEEKLASGNYDPADYYNEHAICTNLNFGYDGTNGHTWYDND